MPAMNDLPIQAILSKTLELITHNDRVVVQAPPGAGKSTLLPLAVLTSLSETSGQIWLLEPRRLAAEQVANRLAQGMNEPLGQSIGLMTGERKVIGSASRLIVMTEAILSQRLIKENDIPDCAIILFDEFHERNLHTDLGLALALQCQEYLRDDLKLVIMSATLDGSQLSERLDCPFIESQGRSFNIHFEYQIPQTNEYLSSQVKRAIHKALTQSGDVLVFLPGVKEINQCQRILEESFQNEIDQYTIRVVALHGQMNAQQQKESLQDTEAQSVILTTDIAKTSLTLPKVTCVIDSGLERVSQFNLRQGMDELVTIKASQASCIQRAGRAGRVQAGHCIRLFSEDDFKQRPPFSPLAITSSDLSPLCLHLAAWGSLDTSEYEFLTPPEPKQIQRSIELLEQLQVVQEQQLTDHGQQVALTPLHPRLSHMIVKAKELNLGYTACVVAAILSEGNPLSYENSHSDLQTRVQLFEQTKLPNFFEGAKVNHKKAKRIEQQAKRFARTLTIQGNTIESHATGLLTMLAYPERIAQKRGNGYRLRSGMGCQLFHGDSIKASNYLAVAEISQSLQQGQHAQSIIRLCANIEQTDIEGLFSEQIIETQELVLNDKQQLQSISRQQLGQIILSESIQPAKPEHKAAYHLQAFSKQGIAYLPLSENQQAQLARLKLAHTLFPEQFPAFDDKPLINDIENWLEPFMANTDFHNLDFSQAFLNRLTWPQQQALNELFPLQYELPSKRKASIDYSEHPPVVRAKLQECFGLTQQPKLAQGKLNINLHLLSPAQRPLAMTQDIAFFWQEAYPEVRKENRGRYAKHPWPEDPLTAEASGLTKKRMEQK